MVSGSALFESSQRIAFYIANDGELSCQPLIKMAWRRRKQCFLPVLAQDSRVRLMHFCQWLPGAALKANRFGILEPYRQPGVLAESLDLILVPLVGFDACGNRIGMGGGFYDATLAFCKTAPRRPFLMGLAHSCQQVDVVSAQAWDVPMDDIVVV